MFFVFSFGPSYHGLLPSVFNIIFFIIFMTIIFNIISSFKYNNKVSYQDIKIKVPSNIVDKREDTEFSNSYNDMNYINSHYYVTFEFESGDRIELEVTENDYNNLDIDAYGDLEYQDNKFISFRKY